MEWRKKATRETDGNKNSFEKKKKPLTSFFYNGIYSHYRKNGTLKVNKWSLYSVQEIYSYLKNNAVLIFSIVPIVLALILLVSLKDKQGNQDAQRTPGVGGIGDLYDSKNHDYVKNEEDEAKKDKLLGIDSAPPLEKTDARDVALHKRVYKVKEGDNLSSISKKFNVSLEAIAGSSDIRMVDSLQVGQTLHIPNKEGFFYSIKKGERLASIISRYNVTYEKFSQENPTLASDLLEAGDEVFLPDAKPDNLIRSWLIPVSSHIITSYYGWRNYPVRSFHKGLDLQAYYAPVRAAKNGRVTYAGWLGGYGNVIVVAHEQGYKSLYGHLSEIYVRPGAQVMQGTIIGKSGNTGYSTGPHLHFEVSHYGVTVNPGTILTGLRNYNRS
ncbi:MAG: M23 family metallopeptidase [Spirochaetia bacterium]|nr:M23 family metallopeptidase [Spirochaetia bacterium]